MICIASCADRWLPYVLSADFFNAAFEFVGGILIWMHTVRAWKDQEIKGVSVWPFVFFWLWGIYNLWYYTHIGQPISGMIAFMPAVANSAYIFSFWLFYGPFNYDRRNDRARWWFISRINRAFGLLSFWGEAMAEAADLPPTRTSVLAALPQKYCAKCCKTQAHDLDNHCMQCDQIN